MAYSYELTGIIDPTGDAYDEENPTKQQEILALELRKILYGFQAEGAFLSLPDNYAGEEPSLMNEANLYLEAINTNLASLRDTQRKTTEDQGTFTHVGAGESLAAAVEKMQLILEEMEQQESIIQIGEGAVWSRSKAVDQW